MLAYRKLYFAHVFGIGDFSERIFKFSVNLIFIMHLLYWASCRNMIAYRKSYFEPLFEILVFSECIYKVASAMSLAGAPAISPQQKVLG